MHQLPKLKNFLVASSSCLCPIHWSQLLSRECRCSWSCTDRWWSNYICLINKLSTEVWLILSLTVMMRRFLMSQNIMIYWITIISIKRFFQIKFSQKKNCFGDLVSCISITTSRFSPHCLVTPYGSIYLGHHWRHSSGSGNGLLPGGTKPLPEPVMTNHKWGFVTFTIGLGKALLPSSSKSLSEPKLTTLNYILTNDTYMVSVIVNKWKFCWIRSIFFHAHWVNLWLDLCYSRMLDFFFLSSVSCLVWSPVCCFCVGHKFTKFSFLLILGPEFV